MEDMQDGNDTQKEKVTSVLLAHNLESTDSHGRICIRRPTCPKCGQHNIRLLFDKNIKESNAEGTLVKCQCENCNWQDNLQDIIKRDEVNKILPITD